MYTLIGRTAMNIFQKEDSEFFFMKVFVKLTNPILNLFKFMTPSFLVRAIVPLYIAWFIFMIRFYLMPIMLGYGAELFISGVIGIATFFGVPLIVISLSVVALGTSLPELITSLVAIKKNEPNFVIGNIIGSNIINIVLVLGTSVVLSPINIYYNEILISILIFIVTTLFFSFISFNRKILSKLDGLILFTIYLIFIYFNFMY